MAKVIRHTYPMEFSIGLLLLIFVISFFLSSQIFLVTWKELLDGTPVYGGMFLVSTAVIVVVLILWEEFLFPIKVKPTETGVVFRNHRTKLKTQILIFCLVPVIFGFIYFAYEVNTVRFFIWCAICVGTPIAGKLLSGIKNYNDFLKVTSSVIEYRNNEKHGSFKVAEITSVTLIRDTRGVLHKIELAVLDAKPVLIDIDEMELDAYCDVIDKTIASQYGALVRVAGIPAG